LQSDLPEKGVAEEDYRRNAIFLIIKTNASFLKDIINKPSTFALLSRKKRVEALAELPISFMFFFYTSMGKVCSSHLPAAPWAPMAVHPAAELGGCSCHAAACRQNLSLASSEMKGKSCQCGTMLP